MTPSLSDKQGLADDLWGGLAAMLVAVPSSIAFGLVTFSALGPGYAAQGALAGMAGAIAVGVMAPLFGGTARLITAPCAPAAAVMAALAGDLLGRAAADGGVLTPAQVIVLLTVTTGLCGLLQLLIGAVGGGRIIKYIPYSVVAGYLSAVGILIFLSQVPKLFGFPAGVGLWTGLTTPSLWELNGLAVGAATIGLMVSAPLVTTVVPAAILGLAAGVATYLVLAWFQPVLLNLTGNPLVIGPIGGTADSLLTATLQHWRDIGRLQLDDLVLIVVPALTLALLLCVDTLKTCVILDALTRARHDSNRELVGQGLANFSSALLGGVPGAGTLGATLVNVNSGGWTRRSGLMEGLLCLAAFLVFGSLVAWVPLAALAGILLVIGWRMVDTRSVYMLRQRSTAFDFVIVASVVATAVAVNLIAAAAVGVGLSILLFVREHIGGAVVRRKVYGHETFSKKSRLPEEEAILARKGNQTVICELQGSVFFGTTDQLFTELERDLGTAQYVILDMRRVQSVDFTAVNLLRQIEGRLAERGGVLIFSDLPRRLPSGQDIEEYFTQVGLVRPAPHIQVSPDLDHALEWVEDRLLASARSQQADREATLALAEVDLLRGLDAETLAMLEACTRDVSYEEGQKIFAQGDGGDELFLIRRGTVRILLPLANGKVHHLATFGKGDFFGDMAFLDGGARSADAVATSPTALYALSRSRFDAVVKSLPALGQQVFTRLARALAIRLRQTNTELRSWKES